MFHLYQNNYYEELNWIENYNAIIPELNVLLTTCLNVMLLNLYCSFYICTWLYMSSSIYGIYVRRCINICACVSHHNHSKLLTLWLPAPNLFVFMPPRACGRRHYVVGLSVRPSVCSSVRLSVCPSGLHFFSEWEGKTGRGDDPGQLKKFRQGGHMKGFNKYLLHYIPLQAGIVRPGGWGGGGSRLIWFFFPGWAGPKQIWTKSRGGGAIDKPF